MTNLIKTTNQGKHNNMKKLFFCFLASIILSSCSTNENGRYVPATAGDLLFIVDTQTGRAYYGFGEDEKIQYRDYILTTEKID
jgi:hypothetical protein